MLTLALAAAAAWGQANQGKPADPGSRSAKPGQGAPTLGAVLLAELDEDMQTLRDKGTPESVLPKVSRLFDTGVVHLNLPGEAEALRRLAIARRLLGQVQLGKGDAATRMLPVLLDHPKLAAALTMSIRAEDDLPGVFAVLADLHHRFPDKVTDEKFASLAAAVCVVFDKPPAHPVLAGTKHPYPAIDPGRVFEHFVTSSSRLAFPPATAPVELLVNVVNVAVSPEEMGWAIQQYAGNRSVGKLYDSVPYDTDVLKRTTHDDKKIFKAPGGFTLANIKRVGGVCEEQAFFATQVGKSIGVPTAYVLAAGSDTGHAYVGYLRADGPRWDFSEGQHDEYKDIEAFVTDPQTGATRPYTVGAITAMLLPVKPEDRQKAVALVDAAARLAGAATSKEALAISLPPGSPPPGKAKPRSASVEDALDLLEMSVKLSPGCLPAWEQVVALGKDKQFPEPAKKTWADMAVRVAGRQYPDFAVWVMAPLIRSMISPEQQSGMWESMSTQFGTRRDLAARCRFEQGDAWAAASKPDRAFAAYSQVVERYPNDGKLAVLALERIERLVQAQSGNTDALVPVYENAMRRISKPGSLGPDKYTQTNYFIVGSRLAELYEQVGKKNDAARIRRMIEADREEKRKGLGK